MTPLDLHYTECHDQPERDAKLAEAKRRQQYLGGTDIPAIMGASPWSTAMHVWERKTADLDWAPLEHATEKMHWGLKLEEQILGEWTRRTGGLRMVNIGTVQHAEHAFLRGTPDGIGVLDGERVLLEAKLVAASQDREWRDGVPTHYWMQVQFYMALTGCRRAHVCVLFGGQRWQAWEVEADDEMQQTLIASAVDFWTHHVVPRIPPTEATDADGQPEGREAAGTAIQHVLAAAFTLRESKLRASKALDELMDQIRDWSGGKAVLLSGKVVASWKQIDRKATTIEAKTITSFSLARSEVLRKVLGDAGY